MREYTTGPVYLVVDGHPTHKPRLLRRSSPRPKAQVKRTQLAAAFGKALATTPPRLPHGQVLTGALRDRPPAERTTAERAAWWLAARGETPTKEAVAKRLAEIEEQRIRSAERKRNARPLAGQSLNGDCRTRRAVGAAIDSNPKERRVPDAGAATRLNHTAAAGLSRGWS